MKSYYSIDALLYAISQHLSSAGSSPVLRRNDLSRHSFSGGGQESIMP